MINKKYLGFVPFILLLGVLTYFFPSLDLYFFNPVLITLTNTIIFYVLVYLVFVTFSLKVRRRSYLFLATLLFLKIINIISLTDLALLTLIMVLVSRKKKLVVKVFVPALIISLLLPRIVIPIVSENIGLLSKALEKVLNHYTLPEVGISNPYFLLVGFWFFLGERLKTYSSILYLSFNKERNFFEDLVSSLIIVSFIQVLLTLLGKLLGFNYSSIPIYAPIVTFYAFYKVCVIVFERFLKQKNISFY